MPKHNACSPMQGQDKEKEKINLSKNNKTDTQINKRTLAVLTYPLCETAPSVERHLLSKGIAYDALYTYKDVRDEGEVILCHVYRQNTVDKDGQTGKDFKVLTYWQNGTAQPFIKMKGIKKPRPLYNLHKLKANPSFPVMVCEGEKAADAAETLFPGYVTTTSPHGSNAVKTADWSPLKDREVVISPDCDDPGQKYAEDVSSLCHGAAKKVSFFKTDVLGSKSIEKGKISSSEREVPKGWDLADALEGGWTADLISSLPQEELFTSLKEFLFEEEEGAAQPEEQEEQKERLLKADEILAHPARPILLCPLQSYVGTTEQLFPEFIVIHLCSKKVESTDLDCLLGRNIGVIVDLSELGRFYADKMFKVLNQSVPTPIFKLNAKLLSRHVFKGSLMRSNEQTVTQSYCVDQAFKDGWRSEEISRLEMSQLFVPHTPLGWKIRLKSKSIFSYSSQGVFKVEKENDNKEDNYSYLCDSLRVVASACDSLGYNHSRLVQFKDKQGKLKTELLFMREFPGDSNEIQRKLLDAGLLTASSRRSEVKEDLEEYISRFPTPYHTTLVDKIGWHEGVYVLPYKIYGSKFGELYHFQPQGKSPVPLDVRGTPNEWQENVARYAKGNNTLLFTIALALTPPLLGFVGEENFAIHFGGDSSRGKSTLLRVASSVWGSEVGSWRTTDNAAESLCCRANDGLLILDELSQADGRAADHLAYMIGNGRGKARANRKGEARDVSEFKLILLSSGEKDLESKLLEVRQEIKAGQTVRFIEIPAEAEENAEHGVFDTVHDKVSGKDLASYLKEVSVGGDPSKRFCGSLAEVWLSKIAQNKKHIIDQVTFFRDEWLKENALSDADGQVERVNKKFALVAAVGQEAINLGLLPFSCEEMQEACRVLRDRWIENRGGVEAQEIDVVIKRLKRFVEEHGSSRFEIIYKTKESREHRREKTLNRAGFRELISEGDAGYDNDAPMQAWRYYMFKEVMKREIIKNMNEKRILGLLEERGFIVPGGDGRKTKIKRVGARGLVRLYHLDSNKLFKEE